MSKKLSTKLTLEEIQSRIDDIEGKYYKGWSNSEEWWRITGDVHPTDRRLWTYYHGLKSEQIIDKFFKPKGKG